MNPTPNFFHTIPTFLTLLSLQNPVLTLNSDGIFLLSFKSAILSDPLSVLASWNSLDQTPCSWPGVNCSDDHRVISLSLPNSHLLGPIRAELGLITTLCHLNLDGNFLNGSLPATLFNASRLQTLSLASNAISGDIPGFSSSSLTSLNLSDNALAGHLPSNFSTLFRNLTAFSLKGNYFSGNLPSGFGSLELLDLSSNLFNGSLPSDLGGSGLRYLNISYNRISGIIPADFAADVPENATVDLSFNNLTGQIPGSKALLGQDPELYSGNLDLCGKPLKNMCIIPSTLSTPPNVTASISPAIAVIPKPVDSSPDKNSSSGSSGGHNNGLRPATIVGITLADFAGVVVLMAIFLYIYQLRSKKQRQQQENPDKKMGNPQGKRGEIVRKDHFTVRINSTISNDMPDKNRHTKCLSYCLRGKDTEDGASSDARTSSEIEQSEEDDDGNAEKKKENGEKENGDSGTGALVMVDGETELEVETLLKASAYILGASGSSIVYKAVLQDGTTFAVRRLGESLVERLRDFEGHVKAIAKLRHPNLLRVRGFYWGSDEKLIIHDFVSNGNLATSGYRKNGSTPYQLPLLVRLKIAKGVAKGLAYIHDKRFVHGNIKPSNILLTPEMDPIIGDLGLSWLVYGSSRCKGSGSARQFGSKRSMGSYDGTQELSVSGSPYISPFGGTNGAGSPYQAPESLKNLKPNPKWDVYSFGIVLLELLTGKVYVDRELGFWTPSSGLEDRFWVLRITDVALRAEIQGKEEAMVSIFKLGFNCASSVPQKRPTMREALQVLEKAALPFVE